MPDMNGLTVGVSLRVTSGGAALMHEMGPEGRTADPTNGDDDPITMLYIEGDRLLLTHYCDTWKNRPRMSGKLSPGGKTVEFEFLDVAGTVQTTERLRAEEARATRAESLRTRAELETLRAQLNPHFLFNTLHSLMALVRHDPLAAEDALERLASLLRHTLMTMKDAEDVALSDELDFVENYLALEHLRLGERLRFEKNIQPESLGCYLPPFTLQPLIENSIRHAIAIQPRGGFLQIKTERRNGILRLEVLDDGPGANPEDVEASKGIGVRTVRQRLMTRYGEQASLRLQTQPGKGFSVHIEIPANELGTA